MFEETAAGLEEQLALQQSSVDKLIDDTRTLEAKIQDAKTKKDTLKARAQAAKTTSKVTGVVGSIDTLSGGHGPACLTHYHCRRAGSGVWEARGVPSNA